MVWSPLNDNDYKTKRRYLNLDKGALKASLLVYIGTKKNPSEDGLRWRWRDSNPCLSCSTI